MVLWWAWSHSQQGAAGPSQAPELVLLGCLLSVGWCEQGLPAVGFLLGKRWYVRGYRWLGGRQQRTRSRCHSARLLSEMLSLACWRGAWGWSQQTPKPSCQLSALPRARPGIRDLERTGARRPEPAPEPEQAESGTSDPPLRLSGALSPVTGLTCAVHISSDGCKQPLLLRTAEIQPCRLGSAYVCVLADIMHWAVPTLYKPKESTAAEAEAAAKASRWGPRTQPLHCDDDAVRSSPQLAPDLWRSCGWLFFASARLCGMAREHAWGQPWAQHDAKLTAHVLVCRHRRPRWQLGAHWGRASSPPSAPVQPEPQAMQLRTAAKVGVASCAAVSRWSAPRLCSVAGPQ